ncbi:N-acetylglucosamine kinase [Gordonia sp. CPCC 205333]|uniref:N-acetylglucosamine kinase n=1 Tax=Gordonia sp. CPCC 205333 TaxID=3140790 RepID=UPI003AF3702E
MSHNAILALDIGGSKTHAVRAVDGVIVSESIVGSANVASVGTAEAGRQLDVVIDRLGGSMGIRAVCAGAAGVDTPESVKILYDLLDARLPNAQVRVVHDSQLILAAAGVLDGIAVISGTGSVAWGRSGDASARAGGWGYLLGDEGSGYWVAREAIRRLLARMDDHHPGQQLGQELAADCGLSDAAELLNHFYAQTDRRYWAGRARVVFEMAKAGDPLSAGIVDAAATALAELVLQVGAQLRIAGPVVMAGGLAVNQPMLQRGVRRILAGRGVADVRVLSVDPVRGAVELAQRLSDR